MYQNKWHVSHQVACVTQNGMQECFPRVVFCILCSALLSVSAVLAIVGLGVQHASAVLLDAQ